jgi:hypothetical protein
MLLGSLSNLSACWRPRRPVLADPAGDVFLGQVEFLAQASVTGGGFERVQVLALEVFDQRQLEHFLVGPLFPDDNGHLRQAGARRPPTPLPATISNLPSPREMTTIG